MIKCICFDLDNTLYSETSYYGECYREIARLISPTEIEQITETMIRIRREVGDRDVFQKIIELYNLGNHYLSEFIRVYRTHNADISLFPDAERFIDVANSSIIHGILTNGGKMTQQNKVRCLGIKEKFDFIVISGAYLQKHEWKPHAKAFQLVSQHAGVEMDECLYVGDSYTKDIVGALNVGMNAVLIEREGTFEKRKYNGRVYWVINTFDRLSRVVEEIEGKNEETRTYTDS